MIIDETTDLNVLRVGKVLIMTPRRLERALLAKEMEKELKKEGSSLSRAGSHARGSSSI